MRLLIASDAWEPQVNGVVRTLQATIADLERRGAAVTVVHPGDFRSYPLPSYPEIRLAAATPRRLRARLRELKPDAVHIATEGPVGWAARGACNSLGLAFTTSYHTRFPEYLRARLPVPVSWSYALLRRFHGSAAAIMVTTATMHRLLSEQGFSRLGIWSRGVDTGLFRPRAGSTLDLPRPIFLTVARVAVEKNLEAFLGLDLPGSKVVAGDGPARAELAARYPDAVFLGLRTGEDLARIYASSDVFVFPSRTDTFGIVLLEALASGLPVAAYPAPGPLDVVGEGGVAALGEDLRAQALAALEIPRERCRAFALAHSWSAATDQFLAHLIGVDGRPCRLPEDAPAVP